MYQVKGEYPDYKKSSLKSNFHLNADQVFNPTTWKPPIYWEGLIGGEKVKFIQIDSSGHSKECFDWKDFPKKLTVAIPYIVEAIDNAMRIMD
jgi:hypothetical protein